MKTSIVGVFLVLCLSLVMSGCYTGAMVEDEDMGVNAYVTHYPYYGWYDYNLGFSWYPNLYRPYSPLVHHRYFNHAPRTYVPHMYMRVPPPAHRSPSGVRPPTSTGRSERPQQQQQHPKPNTHHERR
jgi:hypothetical protein